MSEAIKIGFVLPMQESQNDVTDKQVRIDCLATLSGFLTCLSDSGAYDKFVCIYKDVLFDPDEKVVAEIINDFRKNYVSAIVTFGDSIGKKILGHLAGAENKWRIPVFNVAYSLEYADISDIVAIRLWPSARLLSCLMIQAANWNWFKKTFDRQGVILYSDKDGQSAYNKQYSQNLFWAGYHQDEKLSSEVSKLCFLIGYGSAFYAQLEEQLKKEDRTIVTENFLTESELRGSQGGCICPAIQPLGAELKIDAFMDGNPNTENNDAWKYLIENVRRQFSSAASFDKCEEIISTGVENVKWPSSICKYFGYVCCEMLMRACKILSTPNDESLYDYFKNARYFTTKIGPLIVEPIGETTFPVALKYYISGTAKDIMVPEMQKEYVSGYLLERIDEIFPKLENDEISEQFDNKGFQKDIDEIVTEIKFFSNSSRVALLAREGMFKSRCLYPITENNGVHNDDPLDVLYNFIDTLPNSVFDDVVQLDSVPWDVENNDTLRLYRDGGQSIALVSDAIDNLCFAKNIGLAKRSTFAIPLSEESIKRYKKIPKFDGFIYVIPALVPEKSNVENGKVSFLLLHCPEKLTYLAIHVLLSVVTRFFAHVSSVLYAKKLEMANVKSAIGSIMSRNGSHNIGSHVLASLSHNVGTMPDDRVLYQYIQHRMDYIATATTDRPAWTMPTKFVSAMMRRFLSQRHLLDFVSRSEGLKAYQFQNPHEDTSTLVSQPGTIRLHIRRIDDGDMRWNKDSLFSPEKPVVNFIDYPAGKTSYLDKDVEVAIPGGVVGQHAFFTILENILRNAAKHEWAVMQEVDKNADNGDIKESDLQNRTSNDILAQPGLATEGMGYPDARHLYYGTSTDVLDETIFSVVGKTIKSVSRMIIDGEGNDANDMFMFTDYSADKTNAVPGKVRLETKKDTPIGTYKITLIAVCNDGSEVVGDILTIVVRPPHLDIYVDFQDRPQDGKVNVVVWSDCGGKSFDEEAHYLEPIAVSNRLDKEVTTGRLDVEGLSPLQRLQVKMARPFIAADGHLHRENWGLAEMRISAGYLNVSKIEDIGGISKSAKRFSIIRPVVVETADKDKGQTGKRHCLGYFFSIPKPKELLVILPDSMISEGKADQIKSQTYSFSAELKRFGVELAFESSLEVLSNSNPALSFSYVLFKGKPSVLDKLKLGYRLLGAPGSPAWDGAQYTGTLFKRRIQDILSSDPESFVNDLLKGIYVDWMKFVKAQFRGKDLEKRKAMDFPLVIDVYGQKSDTASGMQSKDAEQSLISDVELLDFIFKNTFNSAVDSYLASISTRNKTVRHGLALWRSPGKREVLVEPTRPSISEDGGVIAGEVVQLTRSEMIRRQLGIWCDRDYPSEEDRLCMQTMKSWLEALDVDSLDMDVPRELKDFIDYLGGIIFDQAKAFLCKYEERYVTLPEAMEVKLSASTEKTCSVGDQRVVFTSKDDRKNSPSFANAIAYWRHENYKTERKNHPVYLEALSGAQSYFSVFSELGQSANDGTGEDLNREDTGLVAKLIECGLFKVLIVDERVSRFVAEHEDVKKAFSHIGIDVLDADSSKTIEMFKAQQSLALVEYDIAIVHQGIIDKRLHDFGALADVDAFCRRMEENVPFFAITTGRGTPSTIPPNARVLPFSVVESTLFTRYPEKFILVDTIMSLLPIGGKEAQ